MAQIRAFIAVELGDEMHRKLADVQRRMKSGTPSGSVRWVRPESIHLTLKFLGNVPEQQIEKIAQALKNALQWSCPFSFVVGGTGCFPNPKRPSVAWVGVEDPSGGLKKVQEAVEQALAPLGFAPEGRPFKPHLTLGRISRNANAAEYRAIGECVQGLDVGYLGKVEVKEIVLMRSDLSPDGARYTPLARLSLGGEET